MGTNKETSVGACAYVEMGQSPPSAFVVEGSARGLPFLQGNADFSDVHPRPRLSCTKPLKRAKAGDVLISVRAPVGAINRADQDYCIGRGLAAVRFRNLYPDFGYHALSYSARALRRVAQGTTFEAIGGVELRALVLSYFDPAEQQRIAEILDTLDEAIRKTEGVIAKLRQMKQGLLHDLLTRGLDDNGELRDPDRHPEQFHMTPLGRLPKGWAIDGVRTHCTRVTYGFTNPMPTVSEGPWMLTAADVAYNKVDWETARRTSASAFRALSAKSRPEPGDILVTKDGTLGRVAILDRSNVCVNQSVAVLRPKGSWVGRFLADYLLSPVGQERMMADTGGSTIRHIYISRLAEMPVPMPHEREATEISLRIAAIERRLDDEDIEVGKLLNLKQGLMDDLLTGRVRVTKLIEKAA